MREDNSLCDNMIDRNWVLKRKRKRVSSGLNLSNGKEASSLPSDSPRNIPSVKRKVKGDIDVSQFARKVKGHDGVRHFFFLFKNSTLDQLLKPQSLNIYPQL